ncbi:MAG: TIGR03943 family protein [Dehalococcoidia bacterium]
MVKKETLKAFAAVSLGGLVAWRLWDGSANALVQNWYLPILLISALVLAGLAFAAVWADRDSTSKAPRFTPAGGIAVLLVALPILVGVTFQPAPLGSGSLDQDPLAGRHFSASAASSDVTLRNVYQWAYEFQTRPPAELTGEPVEVVGFVFHKDGTPPDTFLVARFVVACCVADAQGFALPVQWKDAASLPEDHWVRVRGRVATAADGTAVVAATQVEEIDAPSNPYIYP